MVQPVMDSIRHLLILIAALSVSASAFSEPLAGPATSVVPPKPHIPPPQAHLVTPTPVVPGNAVDKFLKWNGETQEETVPHGTMETKFAFWLTNISSEVVTINGVRTSCGCTAAQLPSTPWRIEPGTNGQIGSTMNLANKSGTIIKTVTVDTDKGAKVLMVKSVILPPSADQMTANEREINQKIALSDRQAIFRGDCARCHADSKGKIGHELYASVCGVCHEAEHRAAMVPNLRELKHPTNADYWRNWITHGKSGTLMAAFSEKEGGILTDEQIDSLVKYLSEVMSSKTASQPALPTVPGAAHKPL